MKISGCLLMIILLLHEPIKARDAAREAIKIWGMDVIPSLFPYMVLCRSIAATLKNTKIPSSILACVLGLIGGSPSGAAAFSGDEHGSNLKKGLLFPMCAMTGTLSPVFLLNTLGTWYTIPQFGIRMLCAHLAGTIACALVAALCSIGTVPTKPSQTQPTLEENPILLSIHAVLNVGGCIVFFSVVSASVEVLFPFLGNCLLSLIHASLEIAGGLHQMAGFGFGSVVCSGFAGFGGLSILLQNHYFLQRHGIRFYDLFFIAIFRALCCAAVMFLIEQCF